MQRPNIAPAVQTPTSRDFWQPPTIQSDFTKQLNTDHPHFIETFRLIPDWMDQEEETWVRAAFFPVDWKSKVGNSDTSTNFKVDWNTIIKKGDIVTRDNGDILMQTWDIKEHMNNQATQAQLCNLSLTLKRHVNAVTDERGYILEPAHDETILDQHPAIISLYAGRPDYSSTTGLPGVNADSLMTGQIQMNPATRNMRINDEFEYAGYTYRIINVDWYEVEMNGTSGIIDFNCKRVAGGWV